MKIIGPAAKMLLVMTVLTGVFYPLVITGIAQLLFAHKAGGSLILRDGSVIGSDLVGQRFTSPKYFWSRPSAVEYNPMPSGGSNLGPTSAALKTLIDERRRRLQMTPHETGRAFPAELLCASGSGLDPHISPEAARFQIPRVALERALDSTGTTMLLVLIANHTEQPAWGVLGEARVNVLRLNLALDSLSEVSK
jgi:K+-transporting ATPase ATPase C chain